MAQKRKARSLFVSAFVFLSFFSGFSGLSALNAETFTFSADRVDSVLAKGKERTTLVGRARVKSGSFLITAERIEISGQDFDILECSGGVLAIDDERGIKIETPRLRYERSRKRSLMEGSSILEDKDNRVVLKALWIENDGQTETTVAQVNVRILKEDLACRSEYALYRRNDKILELTGAPRAFKDGDEYRATRIVVNTDTEEIRLEGAVAGLVKSEKESKVAPGEDEESQAVDGALPGAGKDGPAGTKAPSASGGTTKAATSGPAGTKAAPASAIASPAAPPAANVIPAPASRAGTGGTAVPSTAGTTSPAVPPASTASTSSAIPPKSGAAAPAGTTVSPATTTTTSGGAATTVSTSSVPTTASPSAGLSVGQSGSGSSGIETKTAPKLPKTGNVP